MGIDSFEGEPHAASRAKDPMGKWMDSRPLPTDYVAPTMTLTDEMLAGLKSPRDVADALIDEAYGALKQYCALPAGFKGKELRYDTRRIDHMTPEELDELNNHPPSHVVDAHPTQIEAIDLLTRYLAGDPTVCRDNDSFQPLFGANFVGPPGSAKTHLMSEFARQMKAKLDEKLVTYHDMVQGFVAREYVTYQRDIAKTSNASEGTSSWTITPAKENATKLLDSLKRGGGNGKPASMLSLIGDMGEIVEKKHPEKVFMEKLAQFKDAVSKLTYQPTDFLYLDFDSLWELCRGDATARTQVLDAIVKAKVLFLDDVHPKGDPERMQIVLHVIEGRYAAGRMGTFITTNLTTDEMVTDPEHSHIAERLRSRCSEMFYEIDFKGCIDWRSKVKRRRVKMLQEDLRKRAIKKLSTGAHDWVI